MWSLRVGGRGAKGRLGAFNVVRQVYVGSLVLSVMSKEIKLFCCRPFARDWLPLGSSTFHEVGWYSASWKQTDCLFISTWFFSW